MSDAAQELAELKERSRRDRRRVALISVAASPTMVVLGVVWLLVLPKPAAGIIRIVFGGAACLAWVFMWPWARRHDKF